VIDTIERELEASQIDPSCLTFEITETAAIVTSRRPAALPSVSRRWAAGSRWTTSAPASAPSTTSSTCPSTCSRSIDLLRLYGVDFAQGYGIGRPQPVSEWLGAQPSTSAAITTTV